MPAAMRPTQDHHGSRRHGCAPGRPAVSYAYPTCPRNPPRIDTRDCQRDLSAAVPHMVCTIAAGSRPPVGAPSILMRKDSAAFLVWNPPALASPVCDLPRPLANRCYCEAGECEVESAPTLPPFAIPRCSSLQIPKNAPCSLSRENPLQHLETITKFDRQRISSPCNF